MSNRSNKFVLFENDDDFKYDKKRFNINIRFNRIAFIFFIFFIISLIYSIHLVHLGSRKSNLSTNNQTKIINV